MKASSDAEHYKKKHADEEAAIKDAEEVANTTEAELVVCVYHFLHAPLLSLSIRTGQRPPGRWLRRSSKTLGPQRMLDVNSKVRRRL
jgi:hypothetical protein